MSWSFRHRANLLQLRGWDILGSPGVKTRSKLSGVNTAHRLAPEAALKREKLEV